MYNVSYAFCIAQGLYWVKTFKPSKILGLSYMQYKDSKKVVSLHLNTVYKILELHVQENHSLPADDN